MATDLEIAMQRHNRISVAAPGGGAILAALILVIGALSSRPSQASTVMDVVPGDGSLLDGGALCLTSSTLCPGNATDLKLGTPFAGLSGNFTYTATSATTGTMSFQLTLTSNAVFGSQTMLAGSTFTVSNVDMQETDIAGTRNLSQISQTTGSIVSNANVHFLSGLSVIENTPFVSQLGCFFASGSNECGVELGGSTASGLQFGPDPLNGGAKYNGALRFDAQVTPVPVPGSVWLMLSGLICLFLAKRDGGGARLRVV
jgi:hypothetical protein